MRSAMRTVEKRCDTRMVMPPIGGVRLAQRRERGGVTLEQRVLGFGIERGGRFVEDQHQRPLAHEATRERELLPLPETDFDATGPGRPELRVEAFRQTRDDIVGAGARHGGRHGRLVVEPRQIADADTVPGAEFEAEEVLERAGQPGPPARPPKCAPGRFDRSGCGPLSARTSSPGA